MEELLKATLYASLATSLKRASLFATYIIYATTLFAWFGVILLHTTLITNLLHR